MSRITAANRAQCHAVLATVRSMANGRALQNYALIYKDGVVHYDNEACYSDMSLRVPTKGLKYIVSILKPNKECKARARTKIGRAFIAWLIKTSPYRHAFINNTVEEVLDHGMICPVHLSPQYIFGALSCIRSIDERWVETKLWMRLVNSGCEPTLAYLLSYHLDTYNGRLMPKQRAYGGNHSPLEPGEMGRGEIKDYLLGVMKEDDHTSCKRHLDYRGITEYWGGSNNTHKIDFPLTNYMYRRYGWDGKKERVMVFPSSASKCKAVFNQIYEEFTS